MDGWAHDFFNGLGVEGLHIQERVGRIDGGLGERDVDGAADVSACTCRGNCRPGCTVQNGALNGEPLGVKKSSETQFRFFGTFGCKGR
jgi:hypothetical protein